MTHAFKRRQQANRPEAKADDSVFCFESKEDAENFYKDLKERLEKFNLEIAEEKSKIIAFGRKANNNSSNNDKGKPDTFDFLGFTHYCSKSANGRFRVKRKTSKKKYTASLLKCKEWIQTNRHLPKDILIETLNVKLEGYYRYYGITDNIIMLDKFREEVKKFLFKNLNRRSQRRSYTWEKFKLFMRIFPLAKPRIFVSIFELKKTIGYIM